MTMQPAAVMQVDAPLWATGYLRAFLAERDEPFAGNVWVGKNRPTTNLPRMVSIVRDGGSVRGLIDNPRLRVRVWADKDQEASDLARLVVAAFKVSPGSGPVLSVSSVFGPSPVADSSQPQYLVNVELRLRCLPL